jgi:hypothetical protein
LLRTLLVLLRVVQHILWHVELPACPVLPVLLPLTVTLLTSPTLLQPLLLLALIPLLLLLLLPMLLLLLSVHMSPCHGLLQGQDCIGINVCKLWWQVLSKLLGQQQQQVTLQLLSNRNGHAAIHSRRRRSSIKR